MKPNSLIMKKIVVSLLAVVSALFVVPSFTSKADAQIVKQITIAAADDTLTNADVALVTLTFDGSFKSVEGWVKEVSGVTAGTVKLQGLALDNTNWEDIESLSLTDVATEQFKVFAVPSPRKHKSYRLRFETTGTSVVEIKAWTLRYTGG